MKSINDYLNNPLFDKDSYKVTQPPQYPENMDGISVYIESRSKDVDILWCGLQPIIMEVLSLPITKEMVDEAEEFYMEHIGAFYREDWDYVVDQCDGFIPVTIWAAEEGLVIPSGNVLAVVYCYDKNFVRSVGQLETLLLRVWYPSSVATISYQAKQIIKQAMEISCDNLDKLPWMLHDFGARGVSSPQSAAIGGMAHLINFQGSDTVLGIMGARVWYRAHMAGYSIPASEHSTITSWGLDTEGETSAFRNMIKAFGKKPMFACVSDGNDIEKATGEIWGGTLKDEVLAMDATLVIRPDSGDPIEWLPKLLRILDSKFETVVNTKGYKVLNKVRLIQGDGVTIQSLPLMINAVLEAGYSLDNLAFGMGGGLLQKVDRDTFKWAMKCSAIRVNGVWKDVYKDPITDPGKVSKRGLLNLYKNKQGEFWTGPVLLENDETPDDEDMMDIVYDFDAADYRQTPYIRQIPFSILRANSNL